MISGVEQGYVEYAGWSESEKKIVFPEVMSAMSHLLIDAPDSLYSIGPGADPVNEHLAQNYKVIGIDKYDEQLNRAQSIGIQTIKGDLLNLQALDLENEARGVVPLIFVMHNLHRGELQKATESLSYLCSLGTATLFLDPYCDCPYNTVMGDIKRETIHSETKKPIEPNGINPGLDEFLVRTHLGHGSEKNRVIEYDNHPLHEYIAALETYGFGDISVHLIHIQQHPCYQIVTAKLKRK